MGTGGGGGIKKSGTVTKKPAFNVKKDSPFPASIEQKKPDAASNFKVKAAQPNPAEGGSFRPDQAGGLEEQAQHKFGPEAKKSGHKHMDAKEVGQALKYGTTEEKIATAKDIYNTVREAASEGDPQKAIGKLAANYLHTDNAIGTILWFIWVLAVPASFISPPWIHGFGSLLILNTMLVSTKPAMFITKFILEKIPITAGAVETMDKAGLLDEVKITNWQKAIIVLIDLIVLSIIGFIIILIFALFCYAIQTPDIINSYLKNLPTAVVGKAVDEYFGVPVFDTCGKFTNFIDNTVSNTTGNNNSGGGGGGGGGGPRCQPAQPPSPATVENLANSCFAKYGAEVLRQASIVAQAESNGNPSLPVGAGSCGRGKPPARCVGGEIPVWGLYQINLIVHKIDGLDCPSAFRTASGGRHDGSFCRVNNQCVVVDQVLYNKCAKAAVIAANNIEVACRLYENNIKRGRPGWWDWGNVRNEHANRCGF